MKNAPAYYRPHHVKLTDAVNAALAAHGRCLIIDAHSFPAVPLPYELDQDPNRPDFCIGTDSFHTPDSIASEAQASFLEAGYTVTANRPFAGSLVPLEHYQQDKRLTWIHLPRAFVALTSIRLLQQYKPVSNG